MKNKYFGDSEKMNPNSSKSTFLQSDFGRCIALNDNAREYPWWLR